MQNNLMPKIPEDNFESPVLTVHERLLAMGQMAASLAHELRNPLGSVELYCSLLKKEIKGNEKASEILYSITEGVRTMGHIISNCLQFTKEIRPVKQSFQSAEIFLSQTCEYARPKNQDAIVEIKWKEIGQEAFEMDPYLIGQVLINLVVNAIDAVSGKPHAAVEAILDHSQKDFWKLIVTDNGIGVDPLIRDKLFDPFFTTKEKGTGLGLAIVHAIVEGHNGQIKIEQNQQGGTTVVTRFYNKGK